MTIGTVWAAIPLAHQGGWDELLVVLAPMLVLVGLLGLATRRVNAKLNDQDTSDDVATGGQSGAAADLISEGERQEDPAET